MKIKPIHIGKRRRHLMDHSRLRIMVVMIAFLVGFAVLSLRIFAVAITDKENIAALSGYRPSAPIYSRANIVDRNGVLLAANLTTASLYANPKRILNVPYTVNALQRIFPHLEGAALENKLNSDKYFVLIQRNLTPKEQQQVNSLGIHGLEFQQEEKRIYPHQALASHVVGFTSVDGMGLAGIERYFDKTLSRPNEDGSPKEPLVLSMDVRMQHAVRDTLLKTVKEFKAKAASGIVMDIHSGEILAMVSLPDFDPNTPGDASNGEKFNRNSLGVYEMGSTFKIFNTALALESGKVQMRDVYDISSPIKISKFSIRDYRSKKDQMTVPEIFMYSSNIGSAKMVMDVGIKEQQDFMKRLGLLDPLPIELKEIGSPLYPKKWGTVNAMTISYGHGIAVSPLHMVQATATLMRGGKKIQPTLLKREQQEKDGIAIISEENSDKLRKIMRFTVTKGTGKNASVPGYFVGGKTGTADKARSGSYSSKALLSSFVAAFPMNRPQYVVFVMVDEPIGNIRTAGYATGGTVAAPAVKEIIARIGPIAGITPVDEEEYAIRKEFWFDYGDNAEQDDPTQAAL